MAPVTPPAWQQAGSYSARLDRQHTAALLTPYYTGGQMMGRSGVKPSASSTGLQVTQRATPDRWVSIGAGTCYIAATSATGGSYVCHNDGSYDVVTAASHASLARKDAIIARVYDAVDDVGALNQFTIEVVTGTPASSPARPATPSQSLLLAEVLVPAASTTVTNANITDLRQYVVALGGVLPLVGASDIPANPYPGMKVYRIDLKIEFVYDGTTWQALPYGSWSTYTPAWTAQTTNPSLGNGSATGRYLQIGKLVHFAAEIRTGSTTTYGAGQYRISLPVTARTGDPEQLAMVRLWDNSLSQVYMGQSTLSSTYGALTHQGVNADGDSTTPTTPITFAANDALMLNGTYEAA